jgi:hypothetical protein
MFGINLIIDVAIYPSYNIRRVQLYTQETTAQSISIPASYLFFHLKMKESSKIVYVQNGSSKIYVRILEHSVSKTLRYHWVCMPAFIDLNIILKAIFQVFGNRFEK